MADINGASSLTGQSWVQTPSKKKTPRAVSSLPDVPATAQADGVDEIEVASKAPKLDKMEVCYYDELIALCSKQGITPTTFVEGVLIALSESTPVMDEVIQVAKERRRIRAELGKRRRLETEMKKIGKI
jgi:hypothetical protein